MRRTTYFRQFIAPSEGEPRYESVGAAELVAGAPERALSAYRAALELGDRAEIHLNLGRAWAMLDRREAAFAAFVRSVWINPELLEALPAAARPLVERELARLTGLLAEGRLEGPPRLLWPG